MKKFKGLTFLIEIVSFLQSCDPYSRGYICNDTTQEIELLLTYDYDSLQPMSRNEFLTFFKDQTDNNAILVRIDTTSMIGYYKIKSKTCALIGHGMSGYPPLGFSHLQIRKKNKTLDFPKINENVKKYFKKEGFKLGFGGDYYLKVKQD